MATGVSPQRQHRAAESRGAGTASGPPQKQPSERRAATDNGVAEADAFDLTPQELYLLEIFRRYGGNIAPPDERPQKQAPSPLREQATSPVGRVRASELPPAVPFDRATPMNEPQSRIKSYMENKRKDLAGTRGLTSRVEQGVQRKAKISKATTAVAASSAMNAKLDPVKVRRRSS